jgi:glycosyltransferase involved in cell wall biosynthesis
MKGGGTERQLTYLSRELGCAGFEVHVTLNQGGPNLPALRAAGAIIHELELTGNHDVRVLSRLLRVISSVRPDLVQCWLTQMQIAGGLAALMSRTPWVFAERASGIAYPPTFKNRLRARIGSAASAIVSNSAEGDRYWQSRASPSVRRYVIPNALPLDAIAAAPAATSEEAGLAPGEALVLFAGRLDKQKNASAIVHALSRVRSTVPFRAVLCGDGPLRAEIERLVTGFRLETKVKLIGYTSGLWGLMKRADVVVSTSLFEGSPNVVLEAMACGSPLIVSDIPEHREILDDECATFVNPDDAGAMASGIEAVFVDGAGASRRADRARLRAQRHASPAIARQYLAVYRDILSGHRPDLPAA